MRDLQGIPKTEKELKAEKGKVDIFLDKLAENIKSLQELRAAINIPLRILSKRGVPPNPLFFVKRVTWPPPCRVSRDFSPNLKATNCFVVNAGVGEIVFLHPLSLTDIQCYWYRLRHTHPDKVIWNNCWITENGKVNIRFPCRYMRELSYAAVSKMNNTTDLVGLKTNPFGYNILTTLILSVAAWSPILWLTLDIISLLLLRVSPGGGGKQ